jgi:hypothetical protein
MKRLLLAATLAAFLPSLLPATARCGGAWVPDPGDGYVYLGFSRKTAHTSWNSAGESFDNLTRGTAPKAHHHDFRYGFLSGELGLFENLSATFVITYLDGFEGPKDDLERNHGLSDAWFGLKYQFLHGAWPMAAGVIMRTPIFYDMDGPYERHLYDDEGNFLGNSPEWRGLLKEDFTFAYFVSRSFPQYGAWASMDIGYTYRTGCSSDDIPVNGEVGYRLPTDYLPVYAKAGVNFVGSVGNVGDRAPDDRFGGRPTFNFNDASMLRASASLIFGLAHEVTAEVGYGQWLWGHSARQYKEPFFSVGYRY